MPGRGTEDDRWEKDQSSVAIANLDHTDPISQDSSEESAGMTLDTVIPEDTRMQ